MLEPGTRCVVFDIDDTLYLEVDYVRSGFVAVDRWAQRHLGGAPLGAAAQACFDRGARGDVFDRALGDCGLAPDPALVRRLVEVYRSHPPAIALLPDAARALGGLRGRVALAVVSDGPLASQRAKAEALALRGWADPLVLTGELGPGAGKPSPAGFQAVERATGTAATACVYVADNPTKDFAGPKSRGWATIRVRRPGSLHEAVDSGPDVDVELADLEALAAVAAATSDGPP